MHTLDDIGIEKRPGLARRLGLATATALVVGEVIGVGIFLTPAGMIKSLGSPFWLMVVWLTMGAGAIGGALCYGALAARYPQAGGGYVYLKEAYGPRVAFLYGWLSLFVTDPGLTAMLAAGLANYVKYLVPLSPWEQRGIAVAAILILAAVNMLGVPLGSGILRALVALKLGLLGFLVFWGFAMGSGDWSNFSPFWTQRPGSDPLLPALALGLVGRLHLICGLVGRQQARRRDSRPRAQLASGPDPGRIDRHDRLRRGQRGLPLPGVAHADRGRRHGLCIPGGRGLAGPSRWNCLHIHRDRFGGRKSGGRPHGFPTRVLCDGA